jgi:hypothetical protein
MTAPKFDAAAFDARLVALRILSAELSEVIGRDAAVIDRWREGRGRPDADELIQLRVLDQTTQPPWRSSASGSGVRATGAATAWSTRGSTRTAFSRSRSRTE